MAYLSSPFRSPGRMFLILFFKKLEEREIHSITAVEDFPPVIIIIMVVFTSIRVILISSTYRLFIYNPSISFEPP